MILAVAVLVALGVALLRGGSLTRLATLELRFGGLFLLALLVQLLLFSPLLGPRLPRSWVALLYLGTMLLLIATLLANRGRPGIWLMVLGLLLNGAALSANGGFMPASRDALELAGLMTPERLKPGYRYHNSILMTAESRLRPLGDIMAIPEPLPLANVFSLGDVLLAAGAGWLVYRTTRWGATQGRVAEGQRAPHRVGKG